MIPSHALRRRRRLASTLAGRAGPGRSFSPAAWSRVGLLSFISTGVVVVATASVLALHI